MVRSIARQHAAVLLLLLFFGALYAVTLDSRGMFVWDEAEYASLGRSLLRGEGFAISGQPNSLRLPVLPAAGAASMLLFDSQRDVIVKLPMILFTLTALSLVYGCAAAELGRATGFVAVFFLGLFPSFWRMTSFFLTEIPFIAFFTGAVVFFYFGLYRARYFFYWSWFLWGLSALTRYTAVLFMPIVLLFLLFSVVSRNVDGRKNIWSREFVLAPFVGLVLVAPWLVRQQIAFGDALVGFRRASTSLQHYLPGVSMPWHFYASEVPVMISWIPLVFLCLGAFWAVRTRDRFALHCLMVCIGIVVWFSFYRFKEARQITSILPFLAVLTALGLTKFTLPERWDRRSYALVVFVLAAVFAVSAVEARRYFKNAVALGYPSFYQALRFLREHTSPQAVIVGAAYPQIHWYTDRRAVDFPGERELGTLLERSEWVVVSNHERGQRGYAIRLLDNVRRSDVESGNAAIFQDRLFFTVAIRSSLLKERL